MRYLPFSFLCLMLFLLPIGICAQEKPPVVYGPQIQQMGPHNTFSIRAFGEPGHYTGFDVFADDKLLAPVRFTSRDLLYCPTAAATNAGLTSTLVFDGLLPAPDCGLRLKQSRIVVTLKSQQFPTVAFDLHLASFSPRQWQETIGAQPFHFLTLGMPDATVWHQQGWLNATPRADLFPLLLAAPNGIPELAAAYNPEWSHTPPLSAHPLPVIGLWSPAQKRYAAWDFQDARLNDSSERDIATGFCNRLIVSADPAAPESDATIPPTTPVFDPHTPQSRDGRPLQKRDPRTRSPFTYLEQTSRVFDQRGVSKFVALVYPQGGTDYRQLVYPANDSRIMSHATLILSADLSDTDDPNRLLWQTWWDTPALRRRLPHAPRVNDLGWLPDRLHLQRLPAAPHDSLFAGSEAAYQLPGSLLLSGRNWRNENAVDAPARNGDKTRLAQLQSEARTLLKYARRFTIDKEPCVYWEQPLVGENTPEWGGESATTLHNANGWAAGRLLLDLYRLAKEKGKEKGEGEKRGQSTILNAQRPTPNTLISSIDGVYNWTKHIVWTRNTFPDRPASASALDSALAVAFLLDYYVTFKADPLDTERRSRAVQALELARAFAYRCMIMGAGSGARSADTGREDTAFLWRATAGGAGAEAASVEEIAGSLDTLAQVAAHTGDPILMWALRGSLSRLSRNYREAAQGRTAEPLASDLTGGSGSAPGTMQGEPGQRGGRGFDAALNMLEPVADTNVRVLCGERAALAFDRNTQDITISAYRCTGVGDFAFTLHKTSRRPAKISLEKSTGKSLRNSTKNSTENSTEKADEDSIGVTVTFPYADLSRQPVAVRHGAITQRLLHPDTEVIREPNALWSFIVRGLRDGDTIIVGKPDLTSAVKLPVAPPLTDTDDF